MIDLKDYRKNPTKYHTWAINKWTEIDWELFDQLDEQVKELKLSLEEMLAQRNTLSAKVQKAQKAWEDFQGFINEVKELKWSIQATQDVLDEKTAEFKAILLRIPSPAFDEVPIGKSDEENIILETVGTIPTFDFTPKTHWELLEAKGYLDQERAVKLSWSRFQIMKWGLAELQLALTQRVIQKLIAKWFELAIVPQLVKEDALMTTGYLPNDSTNLYRVNPKTGTEQEEREEDDLRLIWTAEVPLIGQHQWEVFDATDLPRRYVWYSSCFRREAWTYGKDTKWLIRLHQFEKVEMVSFVNPKDALKEHEMLREIEEEIFSDLWIPFNRIDICTGDLGAPAAKKYDLEAWFPWLDAFKEVTSTSNTTDFQTRRGNIKVKNGTEKYFAHSLNGTAVALWRALAAIVENYQTAEGDIRIPEVLQPLMNNKDVI